MMLASDDLLDVLLDVPEPRGERPRIRELLAYLHQMSPDLGRGQVPNLTSGTSSELPRHAVRTGETASSRQPKKRAGRLANGRPARPLFATIRHRARAGPPRGRLHR